MSLNIKVSHDANGEIIGLLGLEIVMKSLIL